MGELRYELNSKSMADVQDQISFADVEDIKISIINRNVSKMHNKRYTNIFKITGFARHLIDELRVPLFKEPSGVYLIYFCALIFRFLIFRL
jgi:hypothetical protein